MKCTYSVQGVNWSLILMYLGREKLTDREIGNRIGADRRAVFNWRDGRQPNLRRHCDGIARLALNYLTTDQMTECNLVFHEVPEIEIVTGTQQAEVI